MTTLRLLVTVAIVLGVKTAYGQTDERESWFFTAQEMEAAYRYQETFGERLRKPVKGRDCLFGRKEFVATRRGKEFSVPCRFIAETVRHLREMLEAGAAKYLFPLDLDHAHFVIPTQLWKKKYSNLPFDQVLPALLRERALMALYHASEHLTTVDSKTGATDPAAQARKDKRNVLGYYDGRRIEILPPNANGGGVGPPENCYSFGGFHFLASQHGELFMYLKNKPITFDITFEIGTTEEEFFDSFAPKKSVN